MKDLYTLFLTFARIGLFTFGGGYAMLPMMQKELCENLKWTAESEIIDYYAIGQCTPGVIAVNVATFVGYKRKGLLGAVAATAGIIAPSVFLITVIAALFRNFAHIETVQHALAGVRVAVCAMLVNAIIRFFKAGVIDWFSFLLFAFSLLLTLIFDFSPAVLVFLSGLSGALFMTYRRSGK